MLTSIVITSYNYEKYLHRCLDSCLGQKNMGDYEVILVDDGSQDETINKALAYGDQITLVRMANQGVEHAANAGILLSRGKYVVRVDADDYLYPDYLYQMTTALERQPDECAFVYPEYDKVDDNGKLIRAIQLPNFEASEIRERGDFLATGTLYRRKVLDAVGLYSEKVKNCGLENYALILKLLSENYYGVCYHQSLFAYRRHFSNLSAQKKQAISAYGSELAKEFQLGQYRINQYHPYRGEEA